MRHVGFLGFAIFISFHFSNFVLAAPLSTQEINSELDKTVQSWGFQKNVEKAQLRLSIATPYAEKRFSTFRAGSGGTPEARGKLSGVELTTAASYFNHALTVNLDELRTEERACLFNAMKEMNHAFHSKTGADLIGRNATTPAPCGNITLEFSSYQKSSPQQSPDTGLQKMMILEDKDKPKFKLERKNTSGLRCDYPVITIVFTKEGKCLYPSEAEIHSELRATTPVVSGSTQATPAKASPARP